MHSKEDICANVPATRKINAYYLISGLGWERAEKNAFLSGDLPFRRKLKSQSGSFPLAGIWTGRAPREHGFFSLFHFDRENSPFGIFRYLKFLFGAGLHPKCIMNRKFSRELAAKAFASARGFSRSFRIYNMPYDRLPLFDCRPKRDILEQDSALPFKNISDILRESGIPHIIYELDESGEGGIDGLIKSIDKNPDFIFVRENAFYSFARRNVGSDESLSNGLKICERRICRLMEALKSTGRPFDLTVISDRGMTQKQYSANLKKILSSLPLKFGRDYVSFSDFSMLRLWYLNENARDTVHKRLSMPDCRGRFVGDVEKKALGIDFPRRSEFGEDIFAMNPGVAIEPSDMGKEAPSQIYGFSTDSPDSFAALLSTRQPPPEIKEICGIFDMMRKDIEESAPQHA